MFAQLTTLYRPYFSLSQKNFKRIVGVSSILLFSLLGSYLFTALQNAFTALSIILSSSEITYALIATGAFECLLPLTLWGIAFQATWSLATWLSNDLRFELQRDLIEKYADSKLYVGIKFIDNKKQEKNNDCCD